MHRARPRRHPEAAPPPGTVGAVVPRRTPPPRRHPRPLGRPEPLRQGPEAPRSGGSPSGDRSRERGEAGGEEGRSPAGRAGRRRTTSPSERRGRALQRGAELLRAARYRAAAAGGGRRGGARCGGAALGAGGTAALRVAERDRERGPGVRAARRGAGRPRGAVRPSVRPSGPVPRSGEAEVLRARGGLRASRGAPCARPSPALCRGPVGSVSSRQVGRRRGRASRPPHELRRALRRLSGLLRARGLASAASFSAAQRAGLRFDTAVA